MPLLLGNNERGPAQISDEYYAELAKVDQSAANNFKANADRAIVSGSEIAN